MAFDYKEYSKLRSIARKRIERLSAAGIIDYVKIPTVSEIRKSENPERYLQDVQSFLGQKNTTVRAARKAEIKKLPPVRFDGKPKKQTKPKPPQTPEQLARRREQKRRSKAKRAVEKAAASPEQAKKYASYLKALETMGKQWREAGIDIGNWIGVLSPKKAIEFAEYMDYRFSQGDFKEQYVVDVFIKDFATMQKKGHNLSDLKKDFDQFLLDRKQLEANAEHTNKFGVSSGEVLSLWKQFVKG